MKKELIISIIIIISVTLTFGCTGTKTTTPTATPTPTHTATPTPTVTPEETQTATPERTAAVSATPKNVEVIIKGLTFDPAEVTISVGDTVVWKNEEGVEHQIKIPEAEAESPILTEGKTFSHTFNAAGTFSYTCTIHPSMKGTVVVK